MGEIPCVMSAWSSRGQTLNILTDCPFFSSHSSEKFWPKLHALFFLYERNFPWKLSRILFKSYIGIVGVMYQLKVSVLVDCFTVTKIKPGDAFNFKSFPLQVLISTDVTQPEE